MYLNDANSYHYIHFEYISSVRENTRQSCINVSWIFQLISIYCIQLISMEPIYITMYKERIVDIEMC